MAAYEEAVRLVRAELSAYTFTCRWAYGFMCRSV
jgi:hypothetical protein